LADIFKDPTKSLPKRDEQIVRVDMEQLDMGGRKSHIPTPSKSGQMTISHVPNAGSKR
jgi:hypothetical protein